MHIFNLPFISISPFSFTVPVIHCSHHMSITDEMLSEPVSTEAFVIQLSLKYLSIFDVSVPAYVISSIISVEYASSINGRISLP